MRSLNFTKIIAILAFLGLAAFSCFGNTYKDVDAIRNEMNQAYNNQNYTKARELALTIPDDATAQNCLGDIYAKPPFGGTHDFAQALKWYKKAAKQGYAKAQYNIGDMYRCGHGVPRDPAKAMKWYRKAAKQGYAKAQYDLGLSYLYGYDVKQDTAQAMNWWLKAAEQGYVQAQRGLGSIYYYRVEDFVQAVHWYCKAAEQGDADAQYHLGMIYKYGYGVAKDINEARRWYEKAAAQGSELAKDALKRL